MRYINDYYPILHQKNFTKINEVYRLEDEEGYGPFSLDQPCAAYLRSHMDPEDLWNVMAHQVCSKTFTKSELQKCYGTMVFGWRTKRLYKQFF